MKKMLFFIVGFIIMTGNALAATSGECGTGCSYTLDDNGLLTVTGSGENASIRSSAFRENSSIRNVVIQGSITSIGVDAFIYSSNIKTMDMSGSQVKNIYTYAFESTGIEKITIPSSVTYIDRDAFHGTRALQEMIISADNVDALVLGSHDRNWRDTNYGTVICQDCTPQQTQALLGKLQAVDATLKGIQISEKDENGNTLFKDIEGHYITGRDLNGNKLDVDSQGHIIAAYNSDGSLFRSYAYGQDGSLSIYDANGKLIALQGKRIFTVSEATAIVQKGGKNTFKIRYR